MTSGLEGQEGQKGRVGPVSARRKACATLVVPVFAVAASLSVAQPFRAALAPPSQNAIASFIKIQAPRRHDMPGPAIDATAPYVNGQSRSRAKNKKIFFG